MFKFLILLLITVPSFAISYKTMEYKDSNIHIIEFNPKYYKIEIAKALGGGIGRENTLSIAQREGAIAAINGSFFDIDGPYNGVSAFLLKVNEQIFVSPNKYSIGYLDNKNHLHIKQIEAKPYINISGITFPCSINMPQKNSPITVYTSAYHKSSLTNPDTLEITVINNAVTNISKQGNSTIPNNGFVISIKGKFPNVKIGDVIGLDYGLKHDIKELPYIISGSDILLLNGKILDTQEGQFYNNLYARSSICRLKNNNIRLFVAEDGASNDIKNMPTKDVVLFFTKLGYSKTQILDMNINRLYEIYAKENRSSHYVGLSLHNFAHALKKYGCIDALNLDGGTSSTMVYKGKIINNINFKPMEVADSIIVKAK